MVRFKEFRVEDVLNVEQTKSVVAKSNLLGGSIPYVTRTVSNNGYTGTCGNVDKVNSGNCITIGAETGVAFYQPNDFVAGNKVYRLSCDGLGEMEYLYLASVLNAQTKNYSYSNARIPEKIKNEIIQLPVTSSGEPDFAYMEQRIAELEAERIAELEAYLVAAGLDDYELTQDDEAVLSQQVETKEFLIIDVFTVKNTHSILKEWVRDGGEYPYVTASEGGNSVTAYVDYDSEYLEEGNCICIGGKTMIVTYQAEDFISNDSHNLALYLHNDGGRNEYAQLYLVSCLQKSLGCKYHWGNSISKKKIQSDIIQLPVTSSGEPDFEYMARYIKAQQKLAIRDAVKLKDEIIETTKQVVGGVANGVCF